MKFKYKENTYKLMRDGSFRIRGGSGELGYSWFPVSDEMTEILKRERE